MAAGNQEHPARRTKSGAETGLTPRKGMVVMEERLLTVEQLAEYLQVSAKTVYRLIHRKEIPCYKVANQWRFKWDVIQEWMEKENFRAPKPAGHEKEKK